MDGFTPQCSGNTVGRVDTASQVRVERRCLEMICPRSLTMLTPTCHSGHLESALLLRHRGAKAVWCAECGVDGVNTIYRGGPKTQWLRSCGAFSGAVRNR
ncbi:hypothetical protein SUGI_0800700 [Cryptomeria japonica]|nr:hypothetical protein SUGI_0800700 [Cryptomeria japonica]